MEDTNDRSPSQRRGNFGNLYFPLPEILPDFLLGAKGQMCLTVLQNLLPTVGYGVVGGGVGMVYLNHFVLGEGVQRLLDGKIIGITMF